MFPEPARRLVSAPGGRQQRTRSYRKTAWERRAGKFLDEIEWYAEALAAQRERRGVPYS
jgi:hypothetical protein